jgi:hypothetical protein
LAYSLTLKFEATRSSKTAVDFQQTTRRHIPENITLQEVTLIIHTTDMNETKLSAFNSISDNKLMASQICHIYFVILECSLRYFFKIS